MCDGGSLCLLEPSPWYFFSTDWLWRGPPIGLRDCVIDLIRENDFISAWMRESTCMRDTESVEKCAWFREIIQKRAWFRGRHVFLPNFSVFALKSEFFIDCVNAWKWQKICVIAWSKTPLGGLFEGTKGSADPGEASQNERSIKRVYRPFGWVGNGVRPGYLTGGSPQWKRKPTEQSLKENEASEDFSSQPNHLYQI